MTNDDGRKPEGAPERSPKAGAGTLALRCSLLWSGACCACVEYLARQRLSRSQRDAAEHATASPWSGRRMFGRRIGRSYPLANSRLPPAWRRLPPIMGTMALCWCPRDPPPCATGDAGERLARAASRWTHRDQAARCARSLEILSTYSYAFEVAGEMAE